MPELQDLTADDFCYLTTTGRVSQRPHTIEIWFALEGQKLYMLSGGGAQADWVKNILKTPSVQVKIRDLIFHGQGRLVQSTEEDEQARHLLYEKYTPRSSDDLLDWSRTALPVVIELAV